MLHQHSTQEKDTERQSRAVKVPEQAMKDEIQGGLERGQGCKLICLSDEAFLSNLFTFRPSRETEADILTAEDTQQITPINEHLTG